VTYRVLLTEDIHPAGRELLAASASVRVARGVDSDTLREELRDVDAVVLRARGRLGRDLLSAGSRLRVVGRYGVGVDNVDVDAATALGIAVVNVPAASAVSVAEHAMGCLLALARQLLAADDAVRTGNWERRHALPGREMQGLVLGIVGMGHVGRELARIAHLGFGMTILYHDLQPDPAVESAFQAEPLELHELLERSDAVSVHVPLHPKTRNLLDRDALQHMKPSAYLLNIARGGIVDEEALVETLRSGRLAGAALDVFSHEPPRSDDQVMDCPRLLLTPHIGALTEEAHQRVSRSVAEDVLRVLRGEQPRHPVHPPRRVDTLNEA
jgi:D-3-phosphoglycerate dehydrogenase / 2-oxoglutarate reductase